MTTRSELTLGSKASIVFVTLASGSWIVCGGLLVASIVTASISGFAGSLDGLGYSFVLFLDIVAILAITFKQQPRILQTDKKPLIITTVNVLLTNKDKGFRIGEELKTIDPDIVIVQEYDANIGYGMSSFLDNYMYCFIAEDGEDGIPDVAIFSKHELFDKRFVYIENRPVLLADIEYEYKPVTIGAVHTKSPTDPERTTVWLEELRYFRIAFQMNQPVIIGGDFNATISHGPFRDVLTEAHLTDLTSGLNTWSSHDGIPEYLHLDHILASPDWVLTEKATKSLGLGSDHTPVTVKVVIP